MMIDGPWSMVAVNDTWRLQMRRSGTEGGGMVGEVEGYLWMRRRAAAVGGCDKRGGSGGEGWGSNAEAEMVCRVSLEYFVRRVR
jgi:hypothetical protein